MAFNDEFGMGEGFPSSAEMTAQSWGDGYIQADAVNMVATLTESMFLGQDVVMLCAFNSATEQVLLNEPTLPGGCLDSHGPHQGWGDDSNNAPTALRSPSSSFSLMQDTILADYQR